MSGLDLVVEWDAGAVSQFWQHIQTLLAERRRELALALAETVRDGYILSAPVVPPDPVPTASAFDFVVSEPAPQTTQVEVYLDQQFTPLLVRQAQTAPYIIRGDPLHWIDKVTGQDAFAQWVVHPGHRTRDWQTAAAARYELWAAQMVQRLQQGS